MKAIILTLLLLPVLAQAQAPAPSTPDPAVLRAINEQVWQPFCASLGTNDANTFLGLHTDDVVRVSIDRNRVRSGEEFHGSTRQMMERMQAAGRSSRLELRFTHRSHGTDAAFEKGVYRFESLSSDFVGYGAFVVLLRKVDGVWKVALDADGQATAADFEAARPMEQLDWAVAAGNGQ